MAHFNRTQDGPDESGRNGLTRRRAIGALLQCGVLACPFGCGVVALGPASLQTDAQPLLAAVGRLVDAMGFLGEPFNEADQARLEAAGSLGAAADAIAAIERVLDPRCLVSGSDQSGKSGVGRTWCRPGSTGRAGMARVPDESAERGGRDGVLNAESPQARPVYRPGTGSPLAPQSVLPADIADRWLVITNHRRQAHGAAALRTASRVPDRAPLQPRSRPPRGADWRHDWRGNSRYRIPQPDRGPLRHRAVARCDACTCATRMAGRRRRRLSFRTRSAASIPRDRSGSRPISSFRIRSTGPTARPCVCRMASSR